MVRGAEVASSLKAGRGQICGILPLDKPAGPTSHDVVDDVRKRLSVRRVGHTGTLDPFASGVLVLCVGRATRLARYIADADKEYAAEVTFGQTTDTLDPTGEVAAREDCSSLVEEAVREAAAQFVGEFEQIPPRFSAVKIDGVRAYAKARRGDDFEGEARTVRASLIEVTSFEPGAVAKGTLAVSCSTGFYVRALARDLGEALSLPAMLTSLRRTRVGSFGIDRCLRLCDLLPGTQGCEQLLPMAAAVEDLAKVELTHADAARICAGQRIQHEMRAEGAHIALMESGELVAVGTADGTSIRPKVVLRTGV